MSNITKIARLDVPIEAGVLITMHFSAGRLGKAEAGAWEFWTVFNGSARTTARCSQGSDPGERFRRMEELVAYDKAWKVAASAKGIRPAKENEIIAWLHEHQADSKFAESCQIGSKVMRVVKRTGGFRLE